MTGRRVLCREIRLSRSDLPTQFLWYLLVGGLSFLADVAIFIGLIGLGAPVMAALAAGFLLGTLVNYMLCLTLAFTGGRHRRSGEILRLFSVAVAGLALTAVAVSGFMSFAGLSPLAAKLLATPLVLVWNYLGRRLLVFRPEMPLAIWQLSADVWTRAGSAMMPDDSRSDSQAIPSERTAGTSRAPLIETLALRERLREEYLARHDPIADERLLWRAQSVRHLAHLLPGQSILELGCGAGRFTRRLQEVTRGENPIVAASFQPDGQLAPAGPEGTERIRLDALPGPLAGREFDCVVWLDLLDRESAAGFLAEVEKLLKPGGQALSFESNPWNPWLKAKRLLARLIGRPDPRGLVSRPKLYELLSAVGFLRIFAVYTDLVYAPLSPRLIWLLRNLSIILENTPFLSRFAGAILLHAEKPHRPGQQDAEARAVKPLAEHRELFDAVSVVIPCRNEEMNVERLVGRLLELYGPYIHEIIPVDDSSRDGTAAALARLAAADPRVRPIYRHPPNGVGRALAEGYRAASGRWVLSMDCDFLHLLPEIRDLFDRAAEGAAVVVGSRFSRHSVLLKYPFAKVLFNRAFHVAAQLAMRKRFRDVTNNLKLLRSDVVARLRLTAPGFAANAETGLQPMLLGYVVEEVPISWIDRSLDMGASSFRILEAGGGYASVLWAAFLARTFGTGPYAGLAAQSRPSRSARQP